MARAIQGVGGGIFPLAFGIIRDEFPRERVAGSIGLMSALLGIGGGVGILAGAAIVEHLSWHWLLRLPLAPMSSPPSARGASCRSRRSEFPAASTGRRRR